MNEICVIGVYFGKLPRYFPLWLKSCANNPAIDFIVFTDQVCFDLPQNVKSYPMTLQEMKQLTERAVGFPVSLERPYKCCDFKVIYGLIFRDYVSDYKYWGHCDFDMIFGDLQLFFRTKELYSYDRFLPLGHLSLYRNSDDVNYRFQCAGAIVEYKTAFTNDKGYAFDEFPGLTRIYMQNGFSMLTERIFADITSIYHRYRIIEEYPLDIKAKNYKHQVFYWENGKIYRAYFCNEIQKEEYIYIHFKKRPDFEVHFNTQNVNAFYITNKGFFEKNGPPTLDDMQRYNYFPGYFAEYLEKLRHDIRVMTHRLGRFIGKVFSRNGTR